MGINMIELVDWNCCGSSSAHSINHRLALDLACRNLSLALPGRPLIAACPSCTLRLKYAQYILQNDAAARERYLKMWGRPFDPDLKVRHFLGLLAELDPKSWLAANGHVRIDLTFVPYYGCMINRIMQGARDSGAECIVTACAMCHMNLEVRCTLKNPLRR